MKPWPRAKTPASCAAEPTRAESREGAMQAFAGRVRGWARWRRRCCWRSPASAQRRATLARKAEAGGAPPAGAADGGRACALRAGQRRAGQGLGRRVRVQSLSRRYRLGRAQARSRLRRLPRADRDRQVPRPPAASLPNGSRTSCRTATCRRSRTLGARLRPAWVSDYLLHPHDLRPNLAQTMPRLSMSPEQARDIATYLTRHERAGRAER